VSSAFRALYPLTSELSRPASLAFSCYVVEKAAQSLNRPDLVFDYLNIVWRLLSDEATEDQLAEAVKRSSDATPDMDDAYTTEVDYWTIYAAGSALESYTTKGRELDAADEVLAALMAGLYPDEPEGSASVDSLPPLLRRAYHDHMALLERLRSYSGPFTRDAMSALAGSI